MSSITELPPEPIEIAPDGSSVRVLMRTERASVVLCTLAAGAISRPVRHNSVEEIWYCLRGSGRLWRQNSAGANLDELAPGRLCAITPGTCFQFRNDAAEPLEILITTIPPWPGTHEASVCAAHWLPSV